MVSMLQNTRPGWPSEKVGLPGISDLLGGVPPGPSSPSIVIEQGHQIGRASSYPVLPSISRLCLHPADMSPKDKTLGLRQMCCVERESAPSPSPVYQHPSPAFTATGTSPVCATTDAIDFEMARLEALLAQPEPDMTAVMQCVAEILDDSVRPAYDQGWFRPGNKFSDRLEAKIAGKGMDELVSDFYTRDENRATYGERVPIPRKSAKEKAGSEIASTEDESDPTMLAQLEKREDSRKQHQVVERIRRDRHRDLQMEGYLRCCDITVKCGSEHAKADKETRSQGGKGPGKDEQLWAAIYAHEMSGRVVQTVNDGRKRAEKVARLLLQFMLRQRSGSMGVHQEQSDSCGRPSHLNRPGHLSLKRSRHDFDPPPRRAWTDIGVDTDNESEYAQSISSVGSPWKRPRGFFLDDTPSTRTPASSCSPAPSSVRTKASGYSFPGLRHH